MALCQCFSLGIASRRFSSVLSLASVAISAFVGLNSCDSQSSRMCNSFLSRATWARSLAVSDFLGLGLRRTGHLSLLLWLSLEHSASVTREWHRVKESERLQALAGHGSRDDT